MNRSSNGFTVIELLVAIAILVLLGMAALWQKNDIDVSSRDQASKTAINAFYYGLTEGYYKQHKSYPTSINAKKLPYIDAKLFTDPSGKKIGAAGSSYHYRPLDCESQACKRFEVSAELEKEADYKKSSPYSR